MSHLLTIRQLLARHPQGFRIAYYQRHYVWGQYRDGDKDSAAYLTECLINAYGRNETYFMQGITLSDNHLVDGQQRITYLKLLLSVLGYDGSLTITYDNRRAAGQWLAHTPYTDITENADEPSQDIYYYKRTLRTITEIINGSGVDTGELLQYILDCVEVLYITIPDGTNEIAIYKMMNGSKAPMLAADIIKADLMRHASDPTQPGAYDWELNAMRSRYAHEWDTWAHWWCRSSIRQYYASLQPDGLDLLLKLCLRGHDDDYSAPLTYEEFRQYIINRDSRRYHTAKHFFEKLRHTQRRIVEAYDDSEAYNRIRAIMLLQPTAESYRFMHLYFIDNEISSDELVRYYKESFLGLTVSQIYAHEPTQERFDDLLASLSMADVYHSDTKRDVFNLLLRLNIDEDIKLKRKFDYSVWSNRSLEHIYSKSKVWHIDNKGHICDGNDNDLHTQRRQIEHDPTYMHRDKIVNHDGSQLSEHCIGNLVLLYGQNNAAFGNATFEQKKQMFLTPGDTTVFQSRNLLHTVCVFAGNSWDHRSIVDNYNQTLKNLKIYYGYK